MSFLDKNGLTKLWAKIKAKFALKTDVPTKVSQLTNDSGYLTSHQDISGKLDNAGANPNCGDGTTITQPSGDAVISIRTTNGQSRDVGILRLSQDNAYICNSSDNTYTFAVWDTDLTQDFSASNIDAASFIVLESGNGCKIRGNTVIHSGNIGSYAITSHQSLDDYATYTWIQQQQYGTSNFSGNYNDLTNRPTVVEVKGTKPTNANKLIDNGVYSTHPGSWDSNDPAPCYAYGTFLSFREDTKQTQFYIPDGVNEGVWVRNNWNTSATSGTAGIWKRLALTSEIPTSATFHLYYIVMNLVDLGHCERATVSFYVVSNSYPNFGNPGKYLWDWLFDHNFSSADMTYVCTCNFVDNAVTSGAIWAMHSSGQPHIWISDYNDYTEHDYANDVNVDSYDAYQLF